MIYLFKISLVNFLARMILLVALCNGIFSIAAKANIVQDYLDLNPEVSVFSLKVGANSETCVAAACQTYPSVALNVPEHIHSNLVSDIPVIRNGLDDVVIANIDPDVNIIKIETKNIANDNVDEFPLRDGDKIDLLYVNEDGVVVRSVGSAQSITSALGSTERDVASKQPEPDQRKLQIDKITSFLSLILFCILDDLKSKNLYLSLVVSSIFSEFTSKGGVFDSFNTLISVACTSM